MASTSPAKKRPSHKVQLDNIRMASLAMDVPALDRMVGDGLLSMTVPNNGATAPDAVIAQYKKWVARVQHVLAFAETGTLVTQAVEVPDWGSLIQAVASLPVTDDFRAWFSQATSTFATAWPEAMAATPSSVGKGDGVRLLTQWMACACMLDLPKAVQEIHAISPLAVGATLPLTAFWGEEAGKFGFEKSNLLAVSPVWVAWQFSSQKCLDALAGLTGMGPDQRIANTIPSGPRMPQGVKVQRELSVTSSLDEKFFVWRCDNSTFTRAVRLASGSIDHPRMAASMASITLEMVKIDGLASHRIPAFLDAGVCDAHPSDTIQKAVIGGMPSLVDRFGPFVNLREINTLVLTRALACHRPDKDLRDVAALKLVLQVLENDGLAQAKALFWGPSVPSSNSYDMPVVHVLRQNMQTLLVGLMNAGVIEPKVPEPGHQSAIETAKGMNSPMLGVMLSWEARRMAHALIHDIDDPTPKGPTS